MSRCLVAVLFVTSTLAHADVVLDAASASSPKQLALVRVGLSNTDTLAGLSYERTVHPQLALVVAADAGLFRRERLSSFASISGELGARWYFSKRPLSGPWFGLSVPLGYSQTTTSRGQVVGSPGGLCGLGGLGGLGGVGGLSTDLTTTHLSVGRRLLLGWTFRFDNGLTFQAAAGPTGTLTRSTTTLVPAAPGAGALPAPEPEVSGGIGLTAFVALGAAF